MWRTLSTLVLVTSLALWPGTAFARIDAPPRKTAQSTAVTKEFLVGDWTTRNEEFGRTVEIIWTVSPDGSLAYQFIIDGVGGDKSSGTWSIEGDVLTERWIRAFGNIVTGTGRVERVDDNTLRLVIIDNGHPDYSGKVRIYRRRGAPQISLFAGPEQ
jgi:hypothetical protein